MIKPEDKEFEGYRFLVKEFKELVGIKNEACYAELKRLTEKILKRVITLPRPKDGVFQIGWLSSAEYIGGEGIIELEFSPKIKPYLLKLKNFLPSISRKM
jgi:plasmid replication initiation protein